MYTLQTIVGQHSDREVKLLHSSFIKYKITPSETKRLIPLSCSRVIKESFPLWRREQKGWKCYNNTSVKAENKMLNKGRSGLL